MIKRIIRRTFVSGLMIGLLTGAVGAQQPNLVVPKDLNLNIMIKTALIAFNHANATGNYTVLRDLASPNFQQANTPARLGEIFRAERTQNVDISPILHMRPTLLRPAEIDANGRLHVQGYFPSKPKQVNFMLVYEAVAGNWRLFALGVHVVVPKIAKPKIRNHQHAAPDKTAAKTKAKTKSKNDKHAISTNQYVRDNWPTAIHPAAETRR